MIVLTKLKNKLKGMISFILIKLGLRFHIYESIGDIESREIIRKKIISIFNNREKDYLKVLMIGSPGLQELKDLPNSILKKMDITSVDLTEPQLLHRLSTKIKFHKYSHEVNNAFDFLSGENVEKFDLIINRWFLHHISKNNKKLFVDLCFPKILDGGYLFTIDWFISNWSTKDGLFNSIFEHYDYRKKYYPVQKNKMSTKGRNKPEYWWKIMHDDLDWHGGKHPSREEIRNNLISSGFSNIEVIDIADSEIIDDPSKWGNVFIQAEK